MIPRWLRPRFQSSHRKPKANNKCLLCRPFLEKLEARTLLSAPSSQAVAQAAQTFLGHLGSSMENRLANIASLPLIGTALHNAANTQVANLSSTLDGLIRNAPSFNSQGN